MARDEALRTSTLKDNDRGTQHGTAFELHQISPKSLPDTPTGNERIQLVGNTDNTS